MFLCSMCCFIASAVWLAFHTAYVEWHALPGLDVKLSYSLVCYPAMLAIKTENSQATLF